MNKTNRSDCRSAQQAAQLVRESADRAAHALATGGGVCPVYAARGDMKWAAEFFGRSNPFISAAIGHAESLGVSFHGRYFP